MTASIHTHDVSDLITLVVVFTDPDLTELDDGYYLTPTAVLFKTEQNDIKRSYKTATGWSSQGNWDASTNTPSLADGTGTAGHFYTVNVAGSQNLGNGLITSVVNDQIYYNGYVWQRLTNVQSTAVTNPSDGTYEVDVYTYQSGDVVYEAEGIGAAQGAAAHVYHVREASIGQ